MGCFSTVVWLIPMGTSSNPDFTLPPDHDMVLAWVDELRPKSNPNTGVVPSDYDVEMAIKALNLIITTIVRSAELNFGEEIINRLSPIELLDHYKNYTLYVNDVYREIVVLRSIIRFHTYRLKS